MNPYEPPHQNQPQGSPGGYFVNEAAGARSGDDLFTNPDLYRRNPPPTPARPPSPGRAGLKRFGIGAAVVVALVACCGGVTALFNDDDDDKPRNTAGATTPTPTRSYTYSPPPVQTTSPPPPPPTTAAPPSPTANALDSVGQGDCLKNEGTDSDPDMVPIKCGPGTYQVLKRIYGTIDSSQCQSVKGATTTYTVTYYINSVPQISQSYVFCLKRR